MATINDPCVLDETAQEIADELQNIVDEIENSSGDNAGS